jgi:hypothetical protein
MTTNFAKAALEAEGNGSQVTMVIGSGYVNRCRYYKLFYYHQLFDNRSETFSKMQSKKYGVWLDTLFLESFNNKFRALPGLR